MTTINNPLGAAMRRADAKRRVLAILVCLPRSEQETLLSDLLSDLLVGNGDASINPDDLIPEPVVQVATPTPARDSMEGLSHKDRIVVLMRRTPGLSIKEITRSIYGNADESSRNSVRSMLSLLGKEGVLRNPSHGRWEIAK